MFERGGGEREQKGRYKFNIFLVRIIIRKIIMFTRLESETSDRDLKRNVDKHIILI